MKHDPVDPDRENLATIPHWTGQFSYRGITCPYTMVGTDPKLGSATTVVPTLLIPLRFVFADGSVFDAATDLVDGQTAIHGILNSPVFQPYNFVTGGTNVGQTQYGDAFQRGNFWNIVSTISPDYHVLLGQPNVLAPQTINVPADKGAYFTDPYTNKILPSVDTQFLVAQVMALIAQLDISPQSLPIFVSGRVTESSGSLALHDSFTTLSGNHVKGAQTYIVANYWDQDLFGGAFSDISLLTHEVNEWLDDPFLNNLTPGWEIPFIPDLYGDGRCASAVYSDALEVADPLQFFRLVISLPAYSFTYHVTDAVFLDFFTRSIPSHSVNGQYSFFNVAPIATPPCTGHLDVKFTFFEFPGAQATSGSGINNHGTVVGSYLDGSNKTHGFLLDKGVFTSIDFPGATETDPLQLNDSGLVVGFYFDATSSPHGFAYQNGAYAPIDFPGSIGSAAYGVNSEGDIVGSYLDLNLMFHGFVLRNGGFLQLNAPFGPQTEVVSINDEGRIAGINEDIFGVPAVGFVQHRNSFAAINFPGASLTEPFSINNSNRVAGLFADSIFGSYIGFVTLDGGLPYENYRYVIGFVFGSNDKGQIVGGARRLGYVGKLPVQRPTP